MIKNKKCYFDTIFCVFEYYDKYYYNKWWVDEFNK